MKRLLFALFAAACLAANTGCGCLYGIFHHGSHCNDGSGNCNSCSNGQCADGQCANGQCGPNGCGPGGDGMAGGGGLHNRAPSMAGPPTGATAYPYYTTRGPRDFLARQPADIGP